MCDIGNRCATAMAGAAPALQHDTLNERAGQ